MAMASQIGPGPVSLSACNLCGADGTLEKTDTADDSVTSTESVDAAASHAVPVDRNDPSAADFSALRFHGVFGPAHRFRARIVPAPVAAIEPAPEAVASEPILRLARRLDWAALLHRVFIRRIDCSLHRAGDRAMR